MTLLWSALAIGALYALVAALFNIGMAQSGVFNFAAPQTVMVGAFVSYEFVSRGPQISAVLLVPICLLVGAVLGYVTELVAVRPVISRGGDGILITTVGVAFVLEGIAFATYGTDGHRVSVFGLDRGIDLLGGRLAVVDIVLVFAAVAGILALHTLTRRSRWGLEGRAVTIDSTSAMLRGINGARGRAQVLMLAGALGSALGILAATKIHSSFDLGIQLLVYAFVAFAVGGIGSFHGCLVGGLIVGLLQAYTARYIGAEYSLIFAFALLLLTLLIRPTGLFGTRQLRLV